MAGPRTNGDASGGEKQALEWFDDSVVDSSSSSTKGAVLSPEGVENIATHQYVPGKYTHLDNFLNPVWLALTNKLPPWMAPNMVTTLGGVHCGISYAVVWYYSYNFDKQVPSWVVFLSAYCTFAYYTLDCMDGKQARRTGTSSPLGQLFDHGFDCICNMSHLSNMASVARLGQNPNWYFSTQAALQFGFFVAQWVEYHTGILPHSAGDFVGVTETIYGIGFLTLGNVFIDRDKFWTRSLGAALPGPVSALMRSSNTTKTVGQAVKKSTSAASSSLYGNVVLDMEMRHVVCTIWAIMIITLAVHQFVKVYFYFKTPEARVSCFSKLLTPALLVLAPYVIPAPIRASNIRKISVATGLMFSLLTKKIIVYGMAGQKYASLQVASIPFLLICLWLRFDGNIKPFGARMLLRGVCLYHAWKLIRWCRVAIAQICDRLDIYCFTIKKKDDAKDD